MAHLALPTILLLLVVATTFSQRVDPRLQQQQLQQQQLQQQHLQQQQQRQRSQGRRPQQQQALTRTTTHRPGDISHLKSDASLTSITGEMLQRFLANEESVARLTNCFVSPNTCDSVGGANLIRQIRRLGLGGRCNHCNRGEQDALNERIYQFIQGYQTRYPSYWRQVLPQIGYILASPTKGRN